MHTQKETFYMICFDSSQRAIHVEQLLSVEFAGIRLVPIPPEIRVSCGLGIKVGMEQFPLLEDRIPEEQIYLVTKEGGKRSVTLWEKE
jgi:hypothetical protein